MSGSAPIVRRGDEVFLRIDDAAFEGKTVARYEGLVVFVEGAVPGDRIRAKITKVKKNLAEARVIAVEEASNDRIQPACMHFGTCGGCRWQHVKYEAQTRFKQQHVVDCLRRLGKLDGFEVLPIIGADEPYWYRNKMEFSFAAREWSEIPPEGVEQSDGVFVGLHVPQRYDKVLDVHTCHLQSEESNAILSYTRGFSRTSGLPVYSSDLNGGYWRFLVIRESKRTVERMVNIVTFEDRPDVMKAYVDGLLAAVPGTTTVVNTLNATRSQIAFGNEEKVYRGDGIIHERMGGFTFSISAQSFFQTNTTQAERLYETAAGFAELRKEDTLYDLYSGTGTIAIVLSSRVRRVIGVESVTSSVKDAEANAKRNGITNCTFISGDLQERLKHRSEWMEAARPRVIIVDPPRSGMHPDIVRSLVEVGAERLVYVSCNPATQARDCAALVAGGYTLAKIRPVDMFPHTYHVENVALLVKNV